MSTGAMASRGGVEPNIGPYRLIVPLGEGGMGVVYRARHVDSGAEVALKMVRVVDAGLLESFRREIFALRSVEHPRIVRIVDDGVQDGHPWYAMDLLRGETLADVIDETHERYGSTRPPSSSLRNAVTSLANLDGDFGVAETLMPTDVLGGSLAQSEREHVLGLMRSLCAPLAYVHGAGLVHRDLKPDNVIIGEGDAPMLVDFGLALRFKGFEPGRDVIEVAGRALGTPPYMAPEQIRGGLVDARADLYAFGCILYECLTGRVPFEGEPNTVMARHLKEKPKPPSQVVAGIPSQLDELVLRLLEKRPRDRLGFAVDVASALADLGARRVTVGDGSPAPRPYLYRPGLAGRSTELSQLQAVLPSRTRRCGGLAFIGGHSGVGKTRLAMELATRAARGSIHVVAGHCIDVHVMADGRSVRGAPLHPFRPLLLSIVDRCQVRGWEEAERILGDRGPVLAAYEPAFRQLPSQRELPDPAPLPAEAAQYRLMDALATTLSRFCAEQPSLVMLDDLQWADEATLALLEHLGADFLQNNQLCIVGTYRSDERTGALDDLLSAPHVVAIELGPLNREAVAEMVADMLALAEPPPALINFLCVESEGNPFFIAEYLRTAVGEGVLHRSVSGDWGVGDEGASPESLRSALPMPGGLRDLVRRRIARLDEEGQRLAEMAAILGREVDAAVLTEAVALGAHAGRRAVELLRARQVLEESTQGSLRFVHDKLREIVYADIGAARLPELHGAAAAAIEANAADLEQLYPSLAHHHALAGNHAKTIEYLEKAGEQALQSAAWGDARKFFEHALRLAESQPQLAIDAVARARWQRRLGDVCYNVGELVDAKIYLGQSLDGLGVRRVPPVPLGDREQIVSALSSLSALAGQVKRFFGFAPPISENPAKRLRFREAALAAERLSQVHYFLNELNQSFGAALECAQHAERLGPSPELARAYATLSTAVSYVPLPKVTEGYGRRADAIAKEVGDPHAIAWTGFMRGLTAMRAGRHHDARRHLAEALEVAKRSGDVRTAQEIQTLLAQAHSIAGDRTAAHRQAEQVLTWALQTRNGQAELWARTALAKNLVDLGKPHAALQAHQASLELVSVSDDESTRMAVAYIGIAHCQLADWKLARSVADDLVAGGRPPRSYHACLGYVAAAEVYLAHWERAQSSSAEVRANVKHVCGVLRSASRIFRSHRPLSLIYEGLSQWLAGKRRGATTSWHSALRIAEQLDQPAEQARAHYELGRHLPSGDAGRRRHLRRAGTLFDRVGARDWSTRLAALAV